MPFGIRRKRIREIERGRRFGRKMTADIKDLLCTAFEIYLDKRIRGALEPIEPYLSYGFDDLNDFKWRGLGGMLVEDELRELTNLLNHWHNLLHKWHAWNDVITGYDGNEALELRSEFVEAVAYYCLLQPSAIRDTFTFVVTNALHQARICVDKDYHDIMDGDPKKPDGQPTHLRRRDKEKRLASVISMWPESTEFLSSLRLLNDQEYQRRTSNYRNLANHAIAPHLGVGITRMVTRSVLHATDLAEQTDGTFVMVSQPGKIAISYTFGGTAPLDVDASRVTNLEQYRIARQCYVHYRALMMAALDRRVPP